MNNLQQSKKSIGVKSGIGKSEQLMGHNKIRVLLLC